MGKLAVVGLGIKLISHLTQEVKIAIESADKVFYISHNNAFDEYLKKLNTNSLSLNYLYKTEGINRISVYIRMKEKVVSEVKDGSNVVFAFYGHPCVCSTPSLLAIKELRNEGYPCIALPAISALDCIFSDLLTTHQLDPHLLRLLIYI